MVGALAASMIVGGAKLSAKAIRGAGRQVAKLSTPKEATDARIAKDEATARRLKESALRAEQAAGGVANLAMAPVRVIGEAAATGAQAASAKFGANTGAGAPAKPPSALARAAGAAATATLEVVGAAGSAAGRVDKAIDEAVREVATAAGDAAYERSVAANGAAYADAVTKKQSDAALSGCMAAWHVVKVADAANYTSAALATVGEVADRVTGAEDAQAGPVLRQGWLAVSRPPLHRRWRWKWVVVRPWSLTVAPHPRAVATSGPFDLLVGAGNLPGGEPTTRGGGCLVVATRDGMSIYLRTLDGDADALKKWRTTIGLAGLRLGSVLAEDAGRARAAELERALDDADRSLVVRVRVLAARNLRPPPTGAASPYATVVPVTPAGAALDGDRCTATPPIADTRDPRWDGLPAVALGSRCCLKRCGFVRVELVASRPDPRPDEPLGSADVPIPPPGGAATAWVPLAPGASSALCLAHVLRKPRTYGDVLVEVANGVAPSTGLNA